jgi:hypothetical protein
VGKVSGWVAKDKSDEWMNEWPDAGGREAKRTDNSDDYQQDDKQTCYLYCRENRT